MSGLKEVVLYIGSVYCFLHVDCWERVCLVCFTSLCCISPGRKWCKLVYQGPQWPSG